MAAAAAAEGILRILVDRRVERKGPAVVAEPSGSLPSLKADRRESVLPLQRRRECFLLERLFFKASERERSVSKGSKREKEGRRKGRPTRVGSSTSRSILHGSSFSVRQVDGSIGQSSDDHSSSGSSTSRRPSSVNGSGSSLMGSSTTYERERKGTKESQLRRVEREDEERGERQKRRTHLA